MEKEKCSVLWCYQKTFPLLLSLPFAVFFIMSQLNLEGKCHNRRGVSTGSRYRATKVEEKHSKEQHDDGVAERVGEEKRSGFGCVRPRSRLINLLTLLLWHWELLSLFDRKMSKWKSISTAELGSVVEHFTSFVLFFYFIFGGGFGRCQSLPTPVVELWNLPKGR